MTDAPVSLTTGPPETVLTPVHPELLGALAQVQALAATDRDGARARLGQVLTADPRCLLGWAELGDLARDVIEAYAAYRVGYHRGLDQLRQSGWRGSGYVRWVHESNRGFLRCLDGLGRTAGVINEVDEAERCALFLRQLDPSWPPVDGPASR